MKITVNPHLANILLREKLTPREIDVFCQLAEGKCNKAVASNLSISLHTQTAHLSRLREKLSLRTPLELVLYAYINGVTKVTFP